MNEEIDVINYIRVLKEKRSLILAVTVAATMIFFVVSVVMRFVSPVYEAETELLVSGKENLQSFTLSNIAGLGDSAGLATRLQIIEGPVISKRATRILNFSDNDKTLAGKLEVKTVPGSAVITIAARDKNPEQAQDIANAFAKAYLTWNDGHISQNLADQRKAVKSQIDQTEDRLARILNEEDSSKIGSLLSNPGIVASVYGDLASRSNNIAIEEKLPNKDVQLIAAADKPTSPILPNVPKNTAVGLILGLVAGIVFAVVSELLRLTDNEQSKSNSEKDIAHPAALDPLVD